MSRAVATPASCALRYSKRRKLNLLPCDRVSLRYLSNASHSSDPSRKTVVFVGGGLGSLSTAHFLLQGLNEALRRRTDIVIIEKQDRTGGWCRTERLELDKGRKLVFETGPRSIRPKDLAGWLTVKMANDVGLGSKIVTVSLTAPSARNRYLFMPDSLALEPVPNSPMRLLTTALSSRSFRSAIKGFVTEPLQPSLLEQQERDSGRGDESVDSFFRRRFGNTIAETYVSAMIHGIYAGDTRKLSLKAVFPMLWEAERSTGSVIRWLIAGFENKRDSDRPYEQRRKLEKQMLAVVKKDLAASDSELAERIAKSSVWGLQDGLQSLVDALRARIEALGSSIRTATQIVSAAQEGTKWSLELSDGSNVKADYMIASSPACLPEQFAPPTIPSVNVAVVSLAFPRGTTDRLVPEGFGYLIPRNVPRQSNPHEALGVLFDSDVMPGIDDSESLGLTKISVLFGGSYWLDRHDHPSPPKLSHQELVEMALDTLKVQLGIENVPEPVRSVSNMQVDCIPQMPPGIGVELARTHSSMRETNDDERSPNISLVGGGPSGVGINAVVQNAWEVGTSIAKAISDEGASSSRVLTGLERWDESEQSQ